MRENNKPGGAILAIDFGLKQTGVAISDPNRRVAVGIGILENLSGRALARAVFAIARDRGATTVLVGSPPVGARNVEPVILGADKLSSALEKRGIKIARWGEAYTTAEALKAREHYGGKIKHGKKWIDEAAAILILQSYLDSVTSRKSQVTSNK